MVDLVEQINADLKQAMKARDGLRKNILKSLKAALDKESKDAGKVLGEADAIAILSSQRKQRLEAAQIYTESNQSERADVENSEAEIIAAYLPEQLGEEEIAKHIEEAIAATGASSPADMGKVMGMLSGQLAGRADLKSVSQLVKGKLAN